MLWVGQSNMLLYTNQCCLFAGLHHEFVRTDRDQFVDIDFKAIDKVHLDSDDYRIEKNTVVYGLKYDFGSNMHYEGCAFAKRLASEKRIA